MADREIRAKGFHLRNRDSNHSLHPPSERQVPADNPGRKTLPDRTRSHHSPSPSSRPSTPRFLAKSEREPAQALRCFGAADFLHRCTLNEPVSDLKQESDGRAHSLVVPAVSDPARQKLKQFV